MNFISSYCPSPGIAVVAQSARGRRHEEQKPGRSVAMNVVLRRRAGA